MRQIYVNKFNSIFSNIMIYMLLKLFTNNHWECLNIYLYLTDRNCKQFQIKKLRLYRASTSAKNTVSERCHVALLQKKRSKYFDKSKYLQETRGMLEHVVAACIELLKLLFLPTCIELLKWIENYIHIYIYDMYAL